jgi:hypothetical protein
VKRQKPLVALGTIRDSKIVESSGLALAQSSSESSPESSSQGKPSSAFWTFNDSGGKPELYRVGFSGETEAVLRLENARNKDWEAMCQFQVEGRSLLAVGDVGDNSFNRKSYQIYVVVEPSVKIRDDEKRTKPEKLKANSGVIDFEYEDGFHNCEAMSFNSEDQSFWFVEKVYLDDRRKQDPGIYVLSKALDSLVPKEANKGGGGKEDSEKKGSEKGRDAEDAPQQKLVARRIAGLPMKNVTGMAFSNDNRRLVIRSYFSACLFQRADDKTWAETVQQTKPSQLAMPLQSQGEAICFSEDGKSVLVTSEMQSSTIWQVRIDQSSETEDSETEDSETENSDRKDREQPSDEISDSSPPKTKPTQERK